MHQGRGMRKKIGLPPGSLLYTGEPTMESIVLRGIDYTATAFDEIERATVDDLLKLKEFGDIPANVEFVSIDFEKESIADALARSSFQQDEKALYRQQ